MAKPAMNLQDGFLNQVRKDGTEVKVVMIDGSQLTGYVKGFDNFTVILHARGMQHLLYKHAIAQLISKKIPTRKEEGEEAGHAAAADALASEAAAPAGPPAPKAPFNTIDLSKVKK